MKPSELLHAYLGHMLSSNPVKATTLGCSEYQGQLGNADGDFLAESTDRLLRYVTDIRACLACEQPPETLLDLKVALSDAAYRSRQGSELVWWKRCPYAYIETVGDALAHAMANVAEAEMSPRNILTLLNAVPGYLSSAERNLAASEMPPLYLVMGTEAANGLHAFLERDVREYVARSPDVKDGAADNALQAAHTALQSFCTWLKEAQGLAKGSWVAGQSYFDALLREYYLLDLDADQLHEQGANTMLEHRDELLACASRLDNSADWREVMARVKERQSTRESLMADYAYHIERSRRHTIDANLVTVPEGEQFELGVVPTFARSSLPMGVMRLAPPFNGSLKSQWLITPVAEGDEDHLRDSCYAYMASISGHETYPGHHLQRVHHNLATRTSPLRAYYSTPLFLEGWGLYVEDLLAETGFMTEPEVLFYKARNALWRSARVVIDTGLHTRGWTFERAVDLLVDEVCLGRRMATGEVRRYVRHDNPTYPSAYELGKLGFHQLRQRWRNETRGVGSLRDFHDQVLGFGSIPLALIEQQLSWKS